MMSRTLAALILATTLLSGTASAASTFAKADAKSRYFSSSDGVRLHYLEAGKGPTIVFVPGWTVPAWMWDPQIRYFAKEHHVVAFDPRSQGKSGRSDEGNNIETRARDIKELVEKLKVGPVVLVGHSLAVAELVSYVDQFGTSTVAGLVLVDFALGPFPKPEETAQFLGFVHLVGRNRKEALGALGASFFKKPPPPGYVDALMDDAMRTPTNTALALLASLMGTDRKPTLAKVKIPVLYVIQPQYKEDGEWLSRNVPSAQVEVFDDAGHVLFMDEPERFNSLVYRFARSAFERRYSPP
jgi:microsomal epoxide hydrolase